PAKRGELNRSWGARLIVLGPYLWLATFFLLPFLIVVKISLSHTAIAQPPYTPVFDPPAGWEGLKQALSALSFENYSSLASYWLHLASYLEGLEVPAGLTFLLLALGSPLSFEFARATRGWQLIVLVLVVSPLSTSFLILMYAWINILQRAGLITQVLLSLGIGHAP